MPLNLEAILDEIGARFKTVKTGLDIGFADETVTETLRNFRGGTWMSINDGGDLPFDDDQFEVVVMNGGVIGKTAVKEANRVLKRDGCLFFSVPAKTRGQVGYTVQEIYRVIREGFDILSIRRPRWWWFGRKPKMFTVCARKKSWRPHRSVFQNTSVPITTIRDHA